MKAVIYHYDGYNLKREMLTGNLTHFVRSAISLVYLFCNKVNLTDSFFAMFNNKFTKGWPVPATLALNFRKIHFGKSKTRHL